MGAGIVFGAVPSVFHYFNPRNGAFVVVWYVTIMALCVATAHWIFLREGAEALIRYPGLLNFPVFFLLTLAGGIAGLAVMIFADIEIPGCERTG